MSERPYLLVGCEDCNRTFWYKGRKSIDLTCPECGTGPFGDWYELLEENQ